MIEKVRARFSRAELERRASDVNVTCADPVEEEAPLLCDHRLVLVGRRAVRLHVQSNGKDRPTLLLQLVELAGPSGARGAMREIASVQLHAGHAALLREHLIALRPKMRKPTHKEWRDDDDDESDQATDARPALGSSRPTRPADAPR